MHIPDGYLGPATCGAMYAVMVPAWAAASAVMRRRLRARHVPYVALAGACSFLVMMFNFPLPGGTSGHAVGAVLPALVIGPWATCLAVSAALLLQALLFGDGGITTLGANCFTMATVMPVCGWLVYRALAGDSPTASPRRAAAAAAAGFVGLNAAALATAVLLGLQPRLGQAADGSPLYCPYGLPVTVPVMMSAHLLYCGWIEAVLTGLAIYYLARTAPEAMDAPGDAPPLLARPARPWLALAALGLLTPIGLWLPGWFGAHGAWGEWGPEEITRPDAAGPHAVKHAPEGMKRLSTAWAAPLPDYALPGQEGQAGLRRSATYILSALVGIAGVGLLVFLLARRFLR